MSLTSTRYKPAVFEDYAQQDFIHVSLQTPFDGWDGVMLVKGEVGPMKEPTPGFSEIRYNFVMQVDGATELEATYDQRRTKTPSLGGGLTFIPCDVLMTFKSDNAVQSFGCSSSKELWARITAEYVKGDPTRISLAPRVNFRDPLTESVLSVLQYELEAGNPSGQLYVDSLMQTLVLHTLVHSSSGSKLYKPSKVTGLTTAQLRLVREFIAANYQREISLAELAGCINFSINHFLRQFKRTIGITPHQYLTQVRVEQARRLLRQGKFTVAEVAAQVGFYDQSHLAHHFKQYYGVSPKACLGQASGVD